MKKTEHIVKKIPEEIEEYDIVKYYCDQCNSEIKEPEDFYRCDWLELDYECCLCKQLFCKDCQPFGDTYYWMKTYSDGDEEYIRDNICKECLDKNPTLKDNLNMLSNVNGKISDLEYMKYDIREIINNILEIEED